VVHFAATVLGRPLDPWQQWLVIHLGEMLEDGRPRFRQVLVVVARQNGKTYLCQVLSLFWMFIERHSFVFGTSTTLEQAKKAWIGAVTMAEQTGALADQLDAKHKKIGNGQQDFWTKDGSHYMIGAADRKGGRGDSIDRAIGDELREQHTWDAYDAAYNAMNARPRAQVVYITNQGDARSIVLNSLRQTAVDEMGLLRPVGLFEWSAAPGSHPTDVDAHAAANPQYGRRMDPDIVISAARRVAKPGADPQALTGFLTEILCMSVTQLDPAIGPAGWTACADPAPIDLEARARLAACVDVSPDQQHITLAVATLLEGGRVRVELVESWDGVDAMARCLEDLPAWIVRVRPKALGWYPGGPAATLDATLRDRRRKGGRAAWPPRGVDVREFVTETPAVVMGFAALVAAIRIAHPDDPRLNAQVDAAEKLWTGDRWVFTRHGAGHVDGLYAAAGAVHLAQTMPARRPSSRTVRVGPNG
jgi:hypothetical protein